LLEQSKRNIAHMLERLT